MSLIRNGGFERGNTDFWSVETDGTLEIDSVNQKYGVYCGKFTSGGSINEVVLSADYIKVTPYQLINGVLWIKSATTKSVYLMIYAYDADYSYIEAIEPGVKVMDGTYLLLNNQFQIPANCAYIRFGFRIFNSSSGEIFYLDGGILNILDMDSAVNGVIELLRKQNYTASGNTSLDTKDMRQFSTYFAQLVCVNVAGSSPTLDVEVKEKDAFGQPISLASFTQVTAASNERIDLPHCQGNQMYIEYTITGSGAEFDFGVAVVGKR